MAVTESPLEPMTLAASVESAKLRRHFGRFDILFFLICTIVGVDTIASVASNGGQAFTWMAILLVIFFIPQALLFAELGTAFPQEGGPYFWTRLAFGRLVGAVTNFLYWITNPVWIGGTLSVSAIGAVEVFYNKGNALPTWLLYTVSVAFVWVSVIAAILSFDKAKWLPTAGAFARFLVLGFFTVSVIIYGAEHGVHGLGASSYSPSLYGVVALAGVLMFNYVGFELPCTAGEEMKNPRRDVPFGIVRSAGASFLLYAIPVLGILIVLPASAVTNFSGFSSAMQQVFTVYGGSVAHGTPALSGAGTVLGGVFAAAFILCLLTSGVTWIMGSDRALAVSCYDGAGPRFLGVISDRFGTPVRVNILSGVVATVVVVLGNIITSGNAAKFFVAILGIAVSTTLISYLGIYPAVWKLRRSHPHVERPFKMPFVPVITVILTLQILFAVIELIAPGVGDSWFSSNYAPSGWDYSERYVYLLTELIPVLAFCAIGALFWLLGSGTRAQTVPATPVPAASAAGTAGEAE